MSRLGQRLSCELEGWNQTDHLRFGVTVGGKDSCVVLIFVHLFR